MHLVKLLHSLFFRRVVFETRFLKYLFPIEIIVNTFGILDILDLANLRTRTILLIFSVTLRLLLKRSKVSIVVGVLIFVVLDFCLDSSLSLLDICLLKRKQLQPSDILIKTYLISLPLYLDFLLDLGFLIAFVFFR